MVKIVQPLSPKTVTTLFWQTNNPGTVQITFGDQMEAPSLLFHLRLDALVEQLPKVYCTIIKNRMNSITSQAVQVVVFHPMEGISGKISPHPIRPLSVVINRVAPRSPILLREVGPELPKVISFRPNMIVHHIQEDGDAFGMAGIYQPLQSQGSAIGILNRVRKNTIITPVPATGELGYRHKFDTVDAQFAQIIQPGYDGFKSSLWGESTDMQFI